MLQDIWECVAGDDDVWEDDELDEDMQEGDWDAVSRLYKLK